MCDMVVEISSTSNTRMKAFHVETCREDPLGEVVADLGFGADFDWWRGLQWLTVREQCGAMKESTIA